MIRLKQLLTEQNLNPYILSKNILGVITWNYPAIEKCKNAKDIAAIIKKADGTFQDDEAAAEAAFMAMTNYSTDINKVEFFYEDVSMALGKDTYAYVKNYMDTSLKYHKQSIDVSMKRLSSLLAGQKEFEISDGEMSREYPEILIRRYGEENLRKYKRNVKNAFRAAKQWWSTYLNLLETQLNFDHNQNQQKHTAKAVAVSRYEPRKTYTPGVAIVNHETIFPLYLKHLSKIKLKFIYDFAKTSIAWVSPLDNDTLHVNVALTIFADSEKLKSTFIHEIQHMLFHIYPLNPDGKYAEIGSRTPIKTTIEIDATLIQNLKNAEKLFKSYGIRMYDLYKIKTTAESSSKSDTDPGYTCRDTEMGSRIAAMRGMLRTGERIQPKHFVPYINGSLTNPNPEWILVCWAQQGFPDFTQYVNKLNTVVKTDSDSKKPDSIKLKSLVPPQTT
jgi:hypothetical protein